MKRARPLPAQSFKPNRKLQPAEVDDLIGRYEQGTNLSELARQFDLHFQTVRAHLRRRGVDLRSSHPVLSDEQKLEVRALYAAGLSTYKLGDRFGVDRDTIRRALRAAGVQMRSHGGK